MFEALHAFTGGRAAFYCPPGPSLGDELIRTATRQLLEACAHQTDAESHTLVVCGGGAWAEIYGTCFYQLSKRLLGIERVLFLPSSVDDAVRLAQVVGKREHLVFCRDEVSHEKCKAAGLQSRLHEDTALGWTYPACEPGKGKIFSFRADLEQIRGVRRTVPAGAEHCNLYQHCGSLAAMLATIGKFSEVHTDQLHVAIAACCMSKTTTLYAGRLSKQRDVWAYSLQSRGVKFEEAV